MYRYRYLLVFYVILLCFYKRIVNKYWKNGVLFFLKNFILFNIIFFCYVIEEMC